MARRVIATAVASAAVLAGSAGPAAADALDGARTTVNAPQSGVVVINGPLVDLRCAFPWFGSAVLGVSLPIGANSIVCADVKAPVIQSESGENKLL